MGSRSANDRNTDKMGAMPAPPPMKTRSAGLSRSVNTPNGPLRSRSSPIPTSLSRNAENSPPG